MVASSCCSGGGGDDYEVTAEFQNASQLVGNEVVVGGVAAGTVKEIELGDDGEAWSRSRSTEEYAPLPTRHDGHGPLLARSPAVANRQVELTTAAGGSRDGRGDRRRRHARPRRRPSPRSTSTRSSTRSTPRPSRTSRRSSRASATPTTASAKQANEGFDYLNPFLSTSRRVFARAEPRPRAPRVPDRRHRSALRALARAPRRHLARSSATSNAMMGAIGAPEAGARRGDRPAPRLHAPGQHHLRQPARRARRRRSARRRRRSPSPTASARSSRSSAPPPPTPCPTIRDLDAIVAPPGQGQRPGRADPPPGAAGRDRRRLGRARLRRSDPDDYDRRRRRRLHPGRARRVELRASQLQPAARDLPRLHA